MATSAPAQIEIDTAALHLVQRADVREAVAAAAERWRVGTPGFLPETYAALRSSIDEVVLLVALQVVNGDPGRPRIVEISTGPHVRAGRAVPGSRWGINNPDTLYFAAPVEPTASYVLRGRPNAGRPTDLNISVQTPDVWGTLDSIGSRDLVLDPEGGFAVTLGRRPAGTGGNHLPIGAGGTVLLIRQTLADWTGDLPYDLSIERTGGPAPGIPSSEDDLARRLIDRLGVVIDHSLRTLQPPIFRNPPNTIPQPGDPGDKPGYLVAQRNTLGHFRLADDEALVLVLSPGGAGYAAVAATGIWGVTADSAQHQNSLNSHQAEPDPDGRITVVLTNTDPGVVNWLDPGGLGEGIVMLRWQLLGQDPDATDEPGVSVRRISVADVPDAMPAARRIDPPARREQIAARGAAYARRFPTG